jgi:hypothetical protein
MKRSHVFGLAVVCVVAAGAGGALAASKLDSPSARSQAIIADAAGQLNIEPAKLSDALKKAIDNQIDAAVKAGTLTPDQATELKKRVDSGQAPLVGGLGLRGFGHGALGARPGFGFGFGHGLFGASAAAATSYLGITAEQLRTELQSGKTLAQIATAHNKTADGLVAALLAEGKKRLDASVASGKLTAAQEQSMLDKLKALLTDAVNGKVPKLVGPGLVPHAFGFGGPRGFHQFRFHPPGAPAPASATPTL